MDALNRTGRKPDKIRSTRLRLGDLNIKLGRDPKIDALYYELQDLAKNKSKGKTVLSRLLTGQAMATITAETSGEEVMRMMREAEEAAESFFNRFGDDE